MNDKKHALKLTTPSEREILLTRIFDAPRDKIFKACTNPDIIPKWWGPRRFSTSVEKLDMRPGGTWRFVSRESDGNEFAFKGTYQEIVPNERIVQTFEFEGMPGHISRETMRLEEENGKTKFTVTSLFATKEDRDGMLQSGMESGAAESYDRLEELLTKT